MTSPSDDAPPTKPAPSAPPEPPAIRSRRRRPAPDTLDVVGSGWFWGGWIGALADLLTLRRVRRRIQESRARRGERVRERATERRKA